MTHREALALKVGAPVSSVSLPPGELHFGVVIEARRYAITISWDDGNIGTTHPDDMELIDVGGAA
jgi:hypothetical protein